MVTEQIKGYKNSRILTEDGIIKADLLIEDGVIKSIGRLDCDGLTELGDDKIIVPGFIDQHIHGAAGHDAIDGTCEGLGCIARALAREGTTGFLATTTTHSAEAIEKAVSTAGEYMSARPDTGAEVLGVHLEGPFISERFLGAQLPEYVAQPLVRTFRKYEQAGGGNIRLVSMATEANGAEELVAYLVSMGVTVSIGHSDATYRQVEEAVRAGATCVTHTYNAQRPLHHREVGTVGAAMLFDELYCELICDGIHVSPPAVKLLQKNKPKDKLVLITDSLRAKYMADGVYEENGGQLITVKNGEARLDDGTLAGSVLGMNAAVRNLMRYTGTDLPTAVRCATENPAKCLGIFHRVGSIKAGKLANLAVVDEEIKVYTTVREGKVIYSEQTKQI